MRLRWTRLALLHLGHAQDYIAREAPDSAAAVVERVERAVMNLARHPYMGREGRVEGTRELVIPGTPFVASYRVYGDGVEILALVHGARRWP